MDNKRKLLAILLFAFSIVFVFFFIFNIERHGARVPEWDEAHHLKMGFYFNQAIFNKDGNLFSKLINNSNQIYPPLHHILIGLSYRIFGFGTKAGLYVNLPFILVLIFSTYKLGHLVGGRWVGFLSALTTPLLPIFLSLQESVFIDYASISLFVASIYFLLRTDNFRVRKFSVLFGITFVLSLLTKWSFLLPMLPFLVISVIEALRASKNYKKASRNIALISLLSLPAVFWYLSNHEQVVNTLSFYSNPNNYPQIIWSTPKGFTIQNLLLYTYTVPAGNLGIGVIPLVTFYFSLFMISKKNKKLLLFLSSVFITIIVLTMINDKAEKYLAYSYPLMIITATTVVSLLKNSILKWSLISVLVISVILNSMITSIGLKKTFIFPGYDKKTPSETWPTYTITDKHITTKNCNGGLLVLTDNKYLNPPNIFYDLLISNKMLRVDAGYYFYNPANPKKLNFNFVEKYDCILSKTGYLGYFANREFVDNLINIIEESGVYTELDFMAPDESTITLYIKNK